MRRALPDLGPALSGAGRWHALAAGKAAGPMLRAAIESALGPPATAVCAAPHPYPGLPAFVEMHLGGHPVPDDGSVDAGRRSLDVASQAAAGDLLLVLLSGGASALLALPAPGVSLSDKQSATQRLLRAGADIHALNAVRKHLSLIKGGRLAAASAAETACLAISDVVDDDPAVIGSGPTVGDPTTFADALHVLDRHGGRAGFPHAVVAWLEAGARTGLHESPKPGSALLSRSHVRVIASRRDALRGAHAEAERQGLTVIVLDEPVTGEAREAARRHLARVRNLVAGRRDPVCVLSAGETTVTVSGGGRGGRNQEFALACVPLLAAWNRPAVIVSQGTDGIDGPTDAAGAIADTSTLARASAAGLKPPEVFLADNDAYRFFVPLDDLLLTGPTGTNVGDIQVLVIGREAT